MSVRGEMTNGSGGPPTLKCPSFILRIGKHVERRRRCNVLSNSLTDSASTISPSASATSVCVLGLGAAQKWSPRGPRRGAACGVAWVGTCGPGLQIWPTCAIIPSLKMTRVNSCHQISLKSFPKSFQVCRINIEVIDFRQNNL